MIWGCLGVVLGMFWKCFGSVLGMFWGCFGDVLGSFWKSFGVVLCVVGGRVDIKQVKKSQMEILFSECI